MAFPFSSSGSSGSARHLVAGEPVGRVGDEDLARLRGRLESLRDDDRVARDERLAARRIAGDDLAGADADPDLEPQPERLLELVVQGREAVAHLERGSQRPQRIVLVQDGSPEDGHHGVADELLDRAAVALERRSHLVVVARHHAPHQLGVAHLAEARSSR